MPHDDRKRIIVTAGILIVTAAITYGTYLMTGAWV